MDRRTKINFLLFCRRFRKNYDYFLNSYNGKNIQLYMDQLINDNRKLAETLFGNKGEQMFREFIDKKMPSV